MPIAFLLAGLAAQSLVNGKLLKTAEGKELGFVDGFKLVTLPTLLFLLYWYNTRPDYLR